MKNFVCATIYNPDGQVIKLAKDIITCQSNNNTSICAMVPEPLIVKQIYEYLETGDFLSLAQYGFCSGCSTSEQLLLAYEYVS